MRGLQLVATTISVEMVIFSAVREASN